MFLATGCRSTRISANDLVPCGASCHESGGDTLPPALAYLKGIACLSWNADDKSAIICTTSFLEPVSQVSPLFPFSYYASHQHINAIILITPRASIGVRENSYVAGALGERSRRASPSGQSAAAHSRARPERRRRVGFALCSGDSSLPPPTSHPWLAPHQCGIMDSTSNANQSEPSPISNL